jgi:hypothetical protein
MPTILDYLTFGAAATDKISTRKMKTKKNVRHHKNSTKKVCSPTAKAKGTISADTCLTPSLLPLIKDEFNKLAKNEGEKIHGNTPKEIWQELQNKMRCDCKSSFDDCWFNRIKDSSMRDKIAKYIFAPTHPKSWNNNPNEWLSNFDILKVIKQYETTYQYFKFFEPTTIDFDLKLSNNKCVSDEICNIDITDYIKNDKKTDFGFIFNLDKHTGGGTHWVSFYFSFKDRFAFFFDSIGSKIPKEVNKLRKRIFEQSQKISPAGTKFIFYQNAPFNHQLGNNECGMYSLFFITTMLTRKIHENPVKNLRTLIGYFKGDNGRITDKQMNVMRKELFNKPTTTSSTDN